MVLVFKTSVKRKQDAKLILKELSIFKVLKVNFDLDDCDNILRVDGPVCYALIIMEKLKDMGFEIEELI